MDLINLNFVGRNLRALLRVFYQNRVYYLFKYQIGVQSLNSPKFENYLVG